MRIITIAHQKGGVGKTTLALNLAYCFKESMKIAILDSDPQGSITGLGELGEIEGIDFISYEDFIVGKITGYDILIIDTPPYLSNKLPDFFGVSDFVLIPTKAGVLDVMAIRATIALLRQSQIKQPSLKIGIVLNMIRSSTSITKEIKAILIKYDMPIMNTMISERVSYARSPITGGVFTTDDVKAQEEIINLANEIIELL
jgi:chromosome partitioning protein